MSEYEQYVDSINKIYGYLEVMKTVWTDQDNISYLENLETLESIAFFTSTSDTIFLEFCFAIKLDSITRSDMSFIIAVSLF